MALVQHPVSRSWWLFVVYGVIGILFGLGMLLWPDRSLIALMLAFGLLSLADAVVSLLSLVRRDLALPRWLLLLYALVSLAFGVLALRDPLGMAQAMLWLLAIWLIVAGIARIVFAVQVRKLVQGEWLLVLSGLLALLLGILFLANPGIGLFTVVLWVGAGALVYGVFQVAVGLRLRRHRLAA